MDYVEGTVSRGVGEYLDVDLTLKSPFTHRLIVLKGLIQRLSPQTFSNNNGGGFHFKLTNGQLVYNNPETADSSMHSLHALVDGELYQKSPTLGFLMDLKYGKNRPDTDLNLKSSVSYIPSQKFGIETKAVSKKLRRFNVDFKFLSELTKEDFDSSTFKLQCFLGNFWNLNAVRKAWNDSGSLDLALEIMPLKRKLALHTHRHHIDSDKLTKFDFESTLQWDVGRDEDQMIFLKFHVQKDDMTDIDGSNLYETRKELTFIGDKHRIHLVAKIPTNLTNGMYNLTAKYLSPADNIYGLNYKNVIAKNDPIVSNQMEIRIDLPLLPPTFVLWNKYFYSVTTPFQNYKLLNDFTILSGDKEAVNVTFSAILLNDNGKDRLYQNGIRIQGLFIPTELTLAIKNEFRFLNHKLVSSSSHFDFPHWGNGQWTLSHEFVDEKDNLYKLNFNWLSKKDDDDSSPDFLLVILPDSIDFSTQFGGHLVSFGDFKLHSNGSLQIVSLPLIGHEPLLWSWDEQVQISDHQTIEANLDLHSGPPNRSSLITDLKLKAGFEREKIVLFQLSLSHQKEFVLSADFRMDTQRPYDLFIFSLSMGKPNYKMWVVSIKQEKDGLDIWVPSVTVSLPGVSIHFLSVLENSQLKKSLTSNFIMYMNGMEEITRSLSLSLEKSTENQAAWNFEIVNIIEHDQTLVKAFGTVVPSGSSAAAWNGSLEAVHFYGQRGGSLNFFVDVGETEKIVKISRQPQNNDKEELVDFKLKTTRHLNNHNKKNVRVTHEGHLIYPSYRNYQNSYVFGLFPGVDYRLDRNFLSLASNDKEEGVEVKILVNQKNFDPLDTSVVKGDFLFIFTDAEKRAFLQYNFGSYQDLVLTDLSWSNQLEPSSSSGGGRTRNKVLTQKLKLITIRSDMDELDAVDTNDEPDVVKVNVTSGFQWITTEEVDSKNNVIVGEEGQERSKSLCLVTEKLIDERNQKTFDVCTLGFSSHRNYSGGGDDGEKILDLKFTLLDRILFNGVRKERVGSLSFGSSFWLDAIDKPSEELKFLVLKETSGTDNVNRNYLFSVKHPFLPRELQIRTTLERDAQFKLSNAVLELDIFEQEIDKVYLIARVLSPISEDDDMDSDFDFDFDDSSPKDSGTGTSEPAKFEASIQSEGLPILLKFEGTVDSFSGTSYSFLDRSGALRQGKFICKLPSLFDPNILQIGETPIVSVAFKGVPRLELHPLTNSKNSLIVEYHGSPHQLRFFNLGSQEEVPQMSNAGGEDENEDGEEEDASGRDRNDEDNFTFYSLTVPILTEEEVMLGFSKRYLGLSNSLLNVTVKLNTSKLIRVENNWKSRGIKEAVSELDTMNSLWLKDLKSNAISSSWGIVKNAIHYKDVVLKALPSIQRLLTKLENEFESNLENIQGDPRTNFFYEFASGALLELYQHLKSATSLMALMAHQFGESIVDFFMDRDWEAEIREAYFYAQDQTVAAILLGLGKINEVLTWAFMEVTKYFETYSTNNPEFDQIMQTIEEVIQAVKTQTVALVRYLLRKTILIRPLLRWALPKEAHEFLVSLKHYFLGQLEQDDGIFQDSDSEFDVGNVTSAYVVLFKGFTAMSSWGQRVLERKGFVLEVEDEALVVQFPLPKPARILRDIFNAPEKESFFGPKYKTSFQGFYQWITEPAVHDSRLPKWSVMMSRLDNVFFGGIGPQDAMALIIDGKIFRTFDGRFHTFDGSCTYLLAADFPNATLAMDGGDGDESLSRNLVFTYGEESLMIHHNSSVEYNGRLAEIPRTESFAEFIALNLGSFKGYRYGNVLGDVREITRDHSGIDVACLVNYPVCSIRLKNYLFSRSSGLLGTNNLESMDEFMTPNGEVVGKTSRFYRSWLLNRECKETKGNILSPLEASPAIKQRCSQIFTSETSPMQPCFDEVPSGEFQEVCERLATEWQTESKGDNGDAGIKRAICTVAAAYWVQCTENRVTIEYLSKC